MQTGTVAFFDQTRGFGFIALDAGGQDVFLHRRALERAGINYVEQGDRLTFELEPDRRGTGRPEAQKISRLED